MLCHDLYGERILKGVDILPASTEDMGSVPGLRRSHKQQGSKIHVPHLLGPCALESVLPNKRSHCNERLVYWN